MNASKKLSWELKTDLCIDVSEVFVAHALSFAAGAQSGHSWSAWSRTHFAWTKSTLSATRSHSGTRLSSRRNIFISPWRSVVFCNTQDVQKLDCLWFWRFVWGPKACEKEIPEMTSAKFNDYRISSWGFVVCLHGRFLVWLDQVDHFVKCLCRSYLFGRMFGCQVPCFPFIPKKGNIEIFLGVQLKWGKSSV